MSYHHTLTNSELKTKEKLINSFTAQKIDNICDYIVLNRYKKDLEDEQFLKIDFYYIFDNYRNIPLYCQKDLVKMVIKQLNKRGYYAYYSFREPIKTIPFDFGSHYINICLNNKVYEAILKQEKKEIIIDIIKNLICFSPLIALIIFLLYKMIQFSILN